MPQLKGETFLHRRITRKWCKPLLLQTLLFLACVLLHMRKMIGLILNVLESILIPQQEILDMKNRRRWVVKVTHFHQQPTEARKLISEFPSHLKN